MDDAEKRLFDQQEASGVNTIFAQYLNSLCAPLYWWIQEGSERTHRILHNGTATLLDTGTSRFGVTCHHVLKQLRVDRANHPDLVCQVGDPRCDIDAEVI